MTYRALFPGKLLEFQASTGSSVSRGGGAGLITIADTRTLVFARGQRIGVTLAILIRPTIRVLTSIRCHDVVEVLNELLLGLCFVMGIAGPAKV